MSSDEFSSAIERERSRRMAACWRDHPAELILSKRPLPSRRASFARPVRVVTFATLLSSFAFGTGGTLIVLGGVELAASWAGGETSTGEDAGVAAATDVTPTPKNEPPRVPPEPDDARSAGVPVDRAFAPVEAQKRVPSAASFRSPARARPALEDVHEAVAAPVPDRESVAQSSAATESAWRRAATALREKDALRADRALSELASSDDPATRDAALLARAQLWISRGQRERARSVLEGLAATAATALIRKRAADLLARGAE